MKQRSLNQLRSVTSSTKAYESADIIKPGLSLTERQRQRTAHLPLYGQGEVVKGLISFKGPLVPLLIMHHAFGQHRERVAKWNCPRVQVPCQADLHTALTLGWNKTRQLEDHHGGLFGRLKIEPREHFA